MNLPAEATIPRRALVLLAVLTLVWGTNWPLFAYAVREVSVWTFRAIAMPSAGAVLLFYAWRRGQALTIPRRHWRRVALATFAYLSVWNVASTYAAVLIPSGQSAVLGFTMPLWAALLSWAVLRQRLGTRLWLAIALAGVGVLLLAWQNLGTYAHAPAGLALGLLSGLGWAVGTLVLKHRPIAVPAAVLAGWQLLLGSVPVVVGAWLLGDHQWFVPSAGSIAVIAYIMLVPMCLGNLCWFSIVGLLPTNLAGLSSILVPVVAMVAGAIVHAEPLGPHQWAAMACCVSALSLALIRPGRG